MSECFSGPLRQTWCCVRGPLLLTLSLLVLPISPVWAQQAAQDAVATATGDAAAQASFLTVREFLAAGGAIGYVIMLLSFLMVALIADAALSLRRSQFIPPGLAEDVHRLLSERKLTEARSLCLRTPGGLSQILLAGLEEVSSGLWGPVEKALEDAGAEQLIRSGRRIEHLSVISTLAPMLGLMGTVWGMIVAFMEFEVKANPQISELAPGIYKALVTTLQGLAVAIPCIAALAFFRSRIDELSSDALTAAGKAFADYRRQTQNRRQPTAP